MHAQLITAALALAGSAFAGKLSSISTTSTITLYAPHHTEPTSTGEHHSACTVCPKDYDRNWGPDTMLNDTRKHHSSFKLFVYPENDLDFDMPGFPLHVLSHKDSRDNMWQLKIGNPVNGDPNSHTRQPKWNLYNNGLQTDGSAPINKTLYFRLYDGRYPKDTENWTGPVFHPIATTMKNKKEYKNERNAKLIADKGWSLVRDGDNPFAYVLKGSKPDGRFFACAIPGAAEAALPDTFDGEDLDIDEASEFMNGMLSPFKLVYSADAPREGFATAGNSLVDRKGCSPVIIKAEGWTHPKQA